MAEAALSSQRGVLGYLRRAVVLASLALVAACSSGRVIPESAPPPVVKAPPPVAPRPISPGLPQDVARHRVALLVPLTGSNAGVGNSLNNATQLALLDSQSEAVRITTYDTAKGAAAAAQRAIDEGNKLILGPLLADDVRTVLPIARAAHVPVLSFSNDASVAGNGAWLLGYSPTQSIERVVDFAKESGISNFVGLMPSGVYGERASTAFLRAVEASGGKVLALETYDRAPGSMNGAIARLNKAPYQAVLLAGPANSAAVAVPVIRRNGGASARLLGTELWNSDSGIGANAALNGAWFASVPNKYYRQYAGKYRARFGSAPYRLSTLGYDSVLLTVRIARDWHPGDDFPVARLSDRDGFVGLDGAFRFGRDGIAERALEVQEIKGGTTIAVSPAPTGFGGK